jgi:hypothetical protein
MWISLDLQMQSQYMQGVQLISRRDNPRPPVTTIQTSLPPCPAHAVWRRDGGLFGIPADATEEPRTLERIPDGYRVLEPLQNDPLGDSIRNGASVFWLIDGETGPMCDEWRFKKAPRELREAGAPTVIESRLTRREKSEGQVVASPVTYTSHGADGLPHLHVGTIEFDGHTALKCECESDYVLVFAEGNRLDMLGLALPANAIAYDPGDVERWYSTQSECHAARDRAVEAIARDGSIATRLGFHAVVFAFGF